MSAVLFAVVAIALVGGVLALLSIDAKTVTIRDRKFNAWLEEDPANRQGSAEWHAYYGRTPDVAHVPAPQPAPVVPVEVEEGAA